MFLKRSRSDGRPSQYREGDGQPAAIGVRYLNFTLVIPMRFSTRTALLIGLLLSLGACDSVSLSGGKVEIRVVNEGSVAFDQLTIALPGYNETFGALPAGAATPYTSVETAYRYAFFEVRAAGVNLRLQPVDYVGEEPLKAGRYTYALKVEEAGSHLLFRLLTDRQEGLEAR